MGRHMVEAVVTVTNKSGARATVVVEPWGMPYDVAPDETAEITFRGPDPDSKVEIATEAGLVTVWGWGGSTCEVFREGTSIGRHDNEVLASPPGVSTREVMIAFGLIRRVEDAAKHGFEITEKWPSGRVVLALPVDRAKRDLAAKLVRDFVAGHITNDELEDQWPLGRGDPALNEIFQFVWSFYDDLTTHRFNGGPDAAHALEQCAAFLESDEPYVWPVRNAVVRLILFVLALVTFGLVTQLVTRWTDLPDYWPFPSHDALQRHLPRT
jgi:hypothetical protein